MASIPLWQTDQPTDPEVLEFEKVIDPRNGLNDLTSTQWIAETVSVFLQRGLGQNHKDARIERLHPAPFSFQDVARLISFFTKQNGKVLDPFCGVASTLKACAVTGRRGVGIELNPEYVRLGRERLETELVGLNTGDEEQIMIEGDALQVVNSFDDQEFDFIVTSPPYWNILAKIDHKARQERIAHNLDTDYGKDRRDLGNISSYDAFVSILASFFNKCARVLKDKRYMCVIVSDFRDKDRFIMFHADLAKQLESRHYRLKGITILYQSRKKVFPYGYPFAYVPNIHHQYILILQKNDH